MFLYNDSWLFDMVASSEWGYDLNRLIAEVTPGNIYYFQCIFFGGICPFYTVDIQFSSGGFNCTVGEYPLNYNVGSAATISVPGTVESELCISMQHNEFVIIRL
jgi:hypothetical protein